MFIKIQAMVNSAKYFRYSFLILFSLVLLNNFALEGNKILYAVTILSLIFLGVSLYDKSAGNLLFSIGIVMNWGYFLVEEPSTGLFNFCLYLLISFLLILISEKPINFSKRIKADNTKFPTSIVKTFNSMDSYTMSHSEKVAKYAQVLARKMNLSEEQCEIIHTGALLHDIGKVGVPKSILNKPGKLDDREYDVMKTHPTIGHKIIRDANMPNKNEVLNIVNYHHERYDGKGYPEGLKGDQIPLEARIVAIADTFDAMTSKRVYRNAFDLPYVLDEIRNNKGTQFDPQIVDVFLSLFEKEEKQQFQSVKLKSL
jgi:putative nucleotidyltransferase with HDIG domain